MTCIQKKKDEARNDKISSNHPVIKTISDELWNMFKILPKDKPSKTVGSSVVPNRKVLDGIPYILETGS